ncbi:MAG: hypothetical protein M1821_005062 [Bathelium mastoideum]|nr:MAG: hypothetical protein M1821_005062 [Bathelium mastoideum]
MQSFRRSPATAFKLLSAAFIVCFYLVYASFRDYFNPPPRVIRVDLPSLQYEGWRGGGKADLAKAGAIRDVVQKTFARYAERAFGKDEIGPVSGEAVNTHNGWGSLVVESTTTLALMGLWDELHQAVRHIIDNVDFLTTGELVDPSETMKRYMGAILSLVDMSDAGLISPEVISHDDRNKLLGQAYTLAFKLRPAYSTNSGFQWPRVNFDTSSGVSSPLSRDENPGTDEVISIPLSAAAASLLESRILSRLLNDASYVSDATYAVAPLLWPSYNISALPYHLAGLFPSPLDIQTSFPTSLDYSWDISHQSFYTALLKSFLIAPHSPHAPTYRDTWLAAAHAVRWNLTSRAAPSPDHHTQHLYLASRQGPHLLNEASPASCAAAAALFLGSAGTSRADLAGLGHALLEGCHHVHASAPSGIAPDRWSWLPALSPTSPPSSEAQTNEPETEAAVFTPTTARAQRQWEPRGWWAATESGMLRPGYAEALFVGWRVTGRARYREWAWEAFQAARTRCEAPHGYAVLRDVMAPDRKAGRRQLGVVEQAVKQAEAGREWIDEQDGEWVSRTLKYLWLVFSDVKVADLDLWVVSEGGHLFRRTEPG